ncbi:MAG TPA: tRNA lysidine(34) synthetase TilS [Candidatus Fimimonas gallinarum]|uniref:tRNA(Ile)-lysidine synthase n=1 Tax=Candidatus Fimimonas gallinarum TaxID=2840821 RepID=A0A9D1J8B0_9BACT|nr:tRNA lysidine(34) synthetase TilS [Candidatus Fimimonas gallinarum]
MLDLDMSKSYALAVSGGVDSMVMLHMFATMNPRPKFFVVTVNHNLRKEASADCRFVANYCKKFGVKCKTFNIDVPSYCQAMKVSEETGARLLRLGVLNSLEVDFVCTAHHADDNAETILMHLIRGSGANGMEGIKRQRGKFLRPLLDYSRADIVEYAQKHNVPHVYDSTNGQVKYTRNFLRNKVIPLLCQLNENAPSNITRFAENISQDNAYLESLADDSQVKIYGDSAEIPSYLLLQPKPIAYRVLRKVFLRLNIWYDIEKFHFDAIIQLADNFGGKRLSLPFNLTAVNDYDKVTILKNDGLQKSYQFEMPFQTGIVQTPVGTVAVVRQPQKDALKFDVKKIPPTAVFRTLKSGDTFDKFGGGGSKPLNRYLIDKKVPARLRPGLLLVADGSNVLIVCGVEIADSVKTEEGSSVCYIKKIITD